MAALRSLLALAGMRAEDCALHSLRMGGTTHPSAGGTTPEFMQRKGRRASNAYNAYIRSHGKDARWVASMMA